jgi:hypothetical protein
VPAKEDHARDVPVVLGHSKGKSCKTSVDCCSGACNASMCTACYQKGSSCVRDTECCSGNCSGTLCGVCKGKGASCSSDGEAAALRWQHDDPKAEPLGRLVPRRGHRRGRRRLAGLPAQPQGR